MLEITIALIKQYAQDCLHNRVSIEEMLDFQDALPFVPFGKELVLYCIGYQLHELHVSEEDLRAAFILLAKLLHKEDWRLGVEASTFLKINSTLHTHDIITE